MAQWWATHTANKHYVLIERAYLALSAPPPGITIDPVIIPGPGDAKQNVAVYLGVKNLGNTPANVTYTLLHFMITDQPLPESPPYDESLLQRIYVSVVKTNSVTIFQNSVLELFTIEEKIRKGVLTLYVLGYVDYIDKFNGRHRCGFARVYHPEFDDPGRYLNKDGTINQEAASKRQNLKFVRAPNYNYDRERNKGEGKDWNEHS